MSLSLPCQRPQPKTANIPPHQLKFPASLKPIGSRAKKKKPKSNMYGHDLEPNELWALTLWCST